jgi:hypothetical protein
MEAVKAFRDAAAEDAEKEKKHGAFIQQYDRPQDVEVLGTHAFRVDWNDPGLIHILQELTKSRMWSTVITGFQEACRDPDDYHKFPKMIEWVRNLETWARKTSLVRDNFDHYAQRCTLECKCPPSWLRNSGRRRCELLVITPKRRKAIALIIMHWLAQDGQLFETETKELVFANSAQRLGASLARFMQKLHTVVSPTDGPLGGYAAHVEWSDLRPLLNAWFGSVDMKNFKSACTRRDNYGDICPEVGY